MKQIFQTSLILLFMAGLISCPATPDPTPPVSEVGLTIITPSANQTVGGTIALAASASDTSNLSSLTFKLGTKEVTANTDGTAFLDTRTQPDGVTTLQASAIINGKPVLSNQSFTILNTLPSSGTVSSAGGALKSTEGSLAMLPPNAIPGSVGLTLEDLTQVKIKATYGVDYEALGVTFLGALDVKATGATRSKLPIQVDLKGFGNKVQPNHQVLMFGLANDADGDGVGELMMTSDAQATSDGSVITRPIPTARVSVGANASSSATRASARVTTSTSNLVPGSILSLNAQGFLPGGTFSNVAIFQPGNLEVLAKVSIDQAVVNNRLFNPKMLLEVVVPNLPAGAASVKFKNLSTGYSSDSVVLSIVSFAGGDAWAGFVNQIKTITNKLNTNRPNLTAGITQLLTQLEAVTPGLAANMVAQSGLVSTNNQTLLASIAPGTYTKAQRDLVVLHAILLDAIAASVPNLEATTAGLAGFLVSATPASSVTPQTTRANIGITTRADQDPGNDCAAAGQQDFGATGMGSAPPPGGSACGNAGGGDGTTGRMARGKNRSVRPVAGAIVRILRRGTNIKLSPFTTLTDENGYYFIPFIAQGEPFTVSAFDPITKLVATADGVGAPFGKSVTLPLIFDTPLKTNGAISSSFTQKPLTNQSVFTFEFDPATSSTETPTVIDRFDWDFGDGSTQSEVIGAKVQHTYKDPGAYTIKLKVTNDSNNTATSSQTLTASSTGDLGQLEVKLTGASLETRSLTSFKVTIPASTEPRTIDVRYSSTHPIAAMREQCVTETNFNLVRASPSGDCGILLQPTENFTFTYTTVSPIYPQTIRPEATFGAYNDPITIRVTTNTGKYSKLEAVIEVPAMPKLKTDGSSFNFPCSEVVDGQTVTPQRLYQFAIPNDWFAFEVNPILYTVYSMGLPNTDLPGQFFFSDPDDNGGGLTNTSRIHQPALGGGGTGVFLVNCKDKVSNSLQVNIVGPSGTLTLGQEASLTPSARGDFYVGVTPANPPLVGTTDSILAVGISGDHLAPQPRGNFFTNLTLASSKRLFGLQGGSTDFTAVLQTSIKSQPEPFAVWLQRSNASGTGTAQVVVDVPKPAQALETNQTVSSGISVGSLPALYTVSAPSGSWVILKNNEDLLVQSLLGTWKIARPSIRDGYSGSWSAAISDGSSQTMQVGAFIAQKQQLTIPFGTSFDTRLETAKKNVANGETVTGTLGFCDHIPGFGSPSTLECVHLYTFDATSGQKLNIGITNNADADYIILDSDAQVVKACNRFSIGVGQCVNTDIPLTKTGKYALVLQATIAKASNYSFTLNLSNP